MRLIIETQAGAAKNAKNGKPKGRSFSVELLGFVTADPLWEPGRTNTERIRPIFLAFAGSVQEARMVWANLRTGHVALKGESKSRGLELLKSVPYQYHMVPHNDGVIYYIYEPSLLSIDPGMVDPSRISFVALPSRAWVNQQKELLPDVLVALHLEMAEMPVIPPYSTAPPFDYQLFQAQALLFLLYLERRTRYPIPTNLLFACQLYMRCLREQVVWRKDPWSHRANSLVEETTDACGLLPGLAFTASHDMFNEILSQEVLKWRALNP